MGYRSETVLVIDHDAISPEEVAEIEAIFGTADAVVNALALYTNDEVKWYDTDPEVAAIERIFQRLEDAQGSNDARYFFFRLGEDDGDLETKGNTDLGDTYRVSWERRVVFQIPRAAA